MSVTLIAGLGNPGPQYLATRHNLGFIVVEALAKELRASWVYERRFKAELAKASFLGSSVLLVKPLTYMNLSGVSLSEVMRYYHYPLSALCVLHDEVAFSLGKARLTITQGSAGHNGVQSIIQCLGKGFLRYRLGIGEKPNAAMDLSDYVLGSFSNKEKEMLEDSLPHFIRDLKLILEQGGIKAMNTINRASSH